MWFEETRGGLLSCENRMTVLAESANGSGVTAHCASKPERGQLWLRKQRRPRRQRERKSSQNGPAKSGAGSFLLNKGEKMQTHITKAQLIEKIAQLRELAKKDVKAMMEALTEVGHKELKKNGVFVVPGFAKFVVVKKPATKARKGINPFNGEEMMFKAKPARRVVRARPVKAAMMAV
jgi:DNA-binding protein HU-beta